jgi:endonuclease YncB( thermonuclease family)
LTEQALEQGFGLAHDVMYHLGMRTVSYALANPALAKSGVLTGFVVFALVRLGLTAEPLMVVQVIDGDTCRLHDNREVRYLGIDAPEKGDPLAEEATQANNTLVSNRDVKLELGRPEKDQNGRTLAYVFRGETFVNEELVRQGWAHVRRPVSAKYRERLLKAQEEAHAAGRGIRADVSDVRLTIAKVSPKISGETANSLNQEFVVIENRGTNVVDLTGWSLSDESNHRYLFPNFLLAPKARVTVRTGLGKNTATDLYWGSRSAIWNDNGDAIFLKDSKGRIVLSHVY